MITTTSNMAFKQNSKYDRASFWSRIYNLWSFELVWNGIIRQIEPSDIDACPKQFESENLANCLEQAWNMELKKKRPSFARATALVFGFDMVPVVLAVLLKQLVTCALQPLMLANMIQFFSDPSSHQYWWACLNCAGVLATGVLYTIFHHPRNYFSDNLALKAQVAWMTLIYRKILRLNMTAFEKTTVGQIVNLISNSMNDFEDFTFMFAYLIAGPILTVVGTYLCYQFIGPAIFIGFSLMLVLIPFNYFMGKLIHDYHVKLEEKTDERVNLMMEIIKFMRTIKMYAWERHFSGLISEARRKEMDQIRKSNYINAIFQSVSQIATPVVMFAMFVSYASWGNTLNAYKVYGVIAIYGSIVFDMTMFFADGIVYIFKLLSSSNRVQNFLMLEEFGKNKRSIRNANYQRSDGVNDRPVVMRNVTICWNKDQHKFYLENISLEVKQAELLIVIGAVGAGKSTLLLSLLNESSIVSGSVNINGKVAYASQEPWCFNGSIEQNILFGKPFDRKKFNRVIEVCALRRDLESMTHREKTLVGERGVILSGGQKARLSLARALYSDADIYLLDDPLSAVDAEVANHIFDRCIGKYLYGKTVVLVTHQVQFIKRASKVLVLEQGCLLAYGTYDHVRLHSGIDLISFIHKSSEKPPDKQITALNYQRQISNISELSDNDEQEIKAENLETGAVSTDVYLKYFKAGSSLNLVLILISSTLICQILFHWSSLWLAQWTDDEDLQVPTDVTFNVIIYAALVVAHLVFCIIKSLSLEILCIDSSIRLHDSIFYTLMRAPISFFDNHPSGRILNRFTKDMQIVDDEISDTLGDLIRIMMEVIGSALVIAYFKWYLLFPAIFVTVLTCLVRVYYVKPSRDLSRYEGSLRSPIYNHTTLTLSGLSTIRAFQAQEMLIKQYYVYQDNHSSTYFTLASMSRLIGFINDWFCQIFIFCTAIVLMVFYEDIGGGIAGMMLTMAFDLTGPIQFGVRVIVELETQMTSVERIVEYTKLEQEVALESNYRFPEGWPNLGRIEFDHVTLSYDDNPTPVLKDICFEVSGGEKLSIVGRTGAGKSSILAALFCMVDIEGRIAIDGVNCSVIGLHELRSKISIIPQDPMAFVGTLRKNLDPFDEHSDGELWDVLDKVQLKSSVEQFSGGLHYKLSEGGGNLSVGQRQLICLGRALLRKNQILILDEATANVDHQTDELIQRTIRSCFAQCTVITIAHRLNTIIDSDRILVLDAGRVVQFDTPRNLLRNGSGIFYNLVQQTGPEMAAKLENTILNVN